MSHHHWGCVFIGSSLFTHSLSSQRTWGHLLSSPLRRWWVITIETHTPLCYERVRHREALMSHHHWGGVFTGSSLFSHSLSSQRTWGYLLSSPLRRWWAITIENWVITIENISSLSIPPLLQEESRLSLCDGNSLSSQRTWGYLLSSPLRRWWVITIETGQREGDKENPLSLEARKAPWGSDESWPLRRPECVGMTKNGKKGKSRWTRSLNGDDSSG